MKEKTFIANSNGCAYELLAHYTDANGATHLLLASHTGEPDNDIPVSQYIVAHDWDAEHGCWTRGEYFWPGEFEKAKDTFANLIYWEVSEL